MSAADYSWDPATRDPHMLPTDGCHFLHHDWPVWSDHCLKCNEPNPNYDPAYDDPWSAA